MAATAVAAAEDTRYVEPTYRLRPEPENMFSPSAVAVIAEEVTRSVLEGKQWLGEEEAVWAVSITEQVKSRVKALNFPRYKIVVYTVLGEEKQQGVRIASRCLRDSETDNCATYTYSNDHLWCNVAVFGMYVE